MFSSHPLSISLLPLHLTFMGVTTMNQQLWWRTPRVQQGLPPLVELRSLPLLVLTSCSFWMQTFVQSEPRSANKSGSRESSRQSDLAMVQVLVGPAYSQPDSKLSATRQTAPDAYRCQSPWKSAESGLFDCQHYGADPSLPSCMPEVWSCFCSYGFSFQTSFVPNFNIPLGILDRIFYEHELSMWKEN